MRKVFVFFNLFFAFINASGQHYQSLLKNGNVWNVLYDGASWCEGWTSNKEYKYTKVYRLSEDSTVNSVLYKKLFFSYDSTSSKLVFYGLIREDTTTKKVYYKKKERIAKKLFYMILMLR